MHRKLPSKFSHRASPHSAKLISHSFTSEKDKERRSAEDQARTHRHALHKVRARAQKVWLLDEFSERKQIS